MRFKLIFILLFSLYFVNAQKPDIVGYDDISINGISNQSTEKELIATFGEPNSTTNPNYDCGVLSSEWNKTKVTLYSWEGIDFHCVNGVLEIGKIDFRKTNPKIKTKQLTFDKNTTLSELKKGFPNSYQIWKKQNEKYGSKIFSVWPTEFSDSEFHIIIENGKIIEFKLYHPY